MTSFPLWRLRPEEAARIIILEPLKPVEHHKHWRKREMRIKPSPRHAPRVDDLKRLALANTDKRGNLNRYWTETFARHAEEFPVIGILIGPMLANGKFFSPEPRIKNALPRERERAPWLGMYSRAQFEHDTEFFERGRALLLENFYLGQTGDGPYIDGLVFKRTDDLLLAEIAHCKARLQATSAILSRMRAEKQANRAKPEDKWADIGADEAVAMKMKQSGYTIRKVGLHNYQLKMEAQ